MKTNRCSIVTVQNSQIAEEERSSGGLSCTSAVLGSPGSNVWLGIGFWEALRVIYL